VIERVRVWVKQKRDEHKLRREFERHRTKYKRSTDGNNTLTPLKSGEYEERKEPPKVIQSPCL